MKPRISIIMPVYNAASYLLRSLGSVCRQTFKDLEIICIDDGSTDESLSILMEHAAHDTRIRVITHEKNRGGAHAMNSGLEAVTGETIGFVDADDVIGKNFYAELWKVYGRGECDIVKGRRKERETDGKWHEINLNPIIRQDALKFTWQWQSAIFRTSFIRQYGLKLCPELSSGKDTLFMHQLMGHEPRIGFAERAIYYYLRNEESITKSQSEEVYLSNYIRMARLLKKYLPAYPHAHQRRKVFAAIVSFLLGTFGGRFSGCDMTPHLPAIKAILSDDESYAPQKEFPLLGQVQNAKNIQELKTALTMAATSLNAKSLRERLRRKPS